MSEITAVVPTLNEERRIGALVGQLRLEVGRVLVTDGGSTDHTVALAEDAGAEVICGEPGRGSQLARAVRRVSSGRVWVVHADTLVPAGAGLALSKTAGRWGCFRVRFDTAGPRQRFTAAWMNARARRSGVCTGDMGQWAEVALLARVGGVPEWPVLEDIELAERLRAVAPCSVVPCVLTTSARRYHQDGGWRTTLRMWGVRSGYYAGVSPERLARWYRPVSAG